MVSEIESRNKRKTINMISKFANVIKEQYHLIIDLILAKN